MASSFSPSSIFGFAKEQPPNLLLVGSSVALAALLALVLTQTALQQLVRHPLAAFPGPRLAALTRFYKAWIECIAQKSWHTHLQELHRIYGLLTREQLHFNDPQAYHDIHNSKNKWDKEESLYHSFGEDRSSFGFLTYAEAKERKDVLNKSFSARAIEKATGLVQGKIDELCDAFTKATKAGKPSDLTYAFRCMTMDIITYYCFGKSIGAVQAEEFQAPLILAMDASQPVFVRFKHSSIYKNMIVKCPPSIGRIVSPSTAGLVDMNEILGEQLKQIMENTEEELKLLPHNQTIYHHLLDPSNFDGGEIPSAGSLYEEGQALMFGGGDTVGNTLMVAAFYLSRSAGATRKLKAELLAAMPDPAAVPPARELEKLPYFNACLKEALRLNSGVISGLPRIVPPGGATIAGYRVPPGAVVSIGSTFVHHSPAVFDDPLTFRPERWLEDSSLDNWLVAFSRGPRSCIGINLAWLELRLAFASVWRRFDIVLDEKRSPDKLSVRDMFLPGYTNKNIIVKMVPVTA